MKLYHLAILFTGFLFLSFCGGCAFFETPQERAGVNPKPFNSQSNWETQPFGGRIIY